MPTDSWKGDKFQIPQKYQRKMFVLLNESGKVLAP